VRSLKPGARLAIIDFAANENLAPLVGVPENRGGHGIPQKVMVEELTPAGLQVEKVINDWSGDDYCVVFAKQGPQSRNLKRGWKYRRVGEETISASKTKWAHVCC